MGRLQKKGYGIQLWIRQMEDERMKRGRKTVCCVIMAAILWATGFRVVTVSAASSNNGSNMNVVFVLDGSGSMANTDRNKLRYEAVELFLGLSTESGNYMGAVVFDNEIVLEQEVSHIEGKEAKKLLSDRIRNTVSNGDTDIGSAIYLATQMLERSGNPDLESAIILLSDGNTDLPESAYGNQLKESEKNKEAAIEYARKNGIKIYSVCLNANGGAKLAEMQEISDATRGECVEVKSSEDLKKVFNLFYDMIYHVKTIVLIERDIPEDGKLDITFDIPLIGIKEANIIINTLNNNITYGLFDPEGYGYTQTELDKISVKAKTFTVIKIQKPEAGTWKLVVRGVPGDHIKIEMVCNYDLSMELQEPVRQAGAVGKGSSWKIAAQIYDEGTAISQEEVYQTYPIHLIVTNKATGKEREFDMSPEGLQSSVEIGQLGYGEYEMQAFCQIGDMQLLSDVKEIQVENTAPVCSENPILIEKTVFPFGENLYLLDLDAYVSDAESDHLNYAIQTSDFEDNVVLLDDSQLTIQLSKCGNGSLSIVAMDDVGASTEVQVDIKITSIMDMLVKILIMLLVMAVLMLLVLKLKAHCRVIRGTIQVITYGEEGTDIPDTFEGGRGKMTLAAQVSTSQNIGIQLEKCFLIPGENQNCIYLVSKTKKGYFADTKPEQRQSKIRLEAGKEVDVSSDVDFTRGMKIIYMPF